MTRQERELYLKMYGKRAYEEYVRKNRGCSGMNTGTRTHRSKKDYNRQADRAAVRKAVRESGQSFFLLYDTNPKACFP